TLLGIESENATRAVAVCQVVVLGMRAERVADVTTARDKNGVAGTDEDDLIRQAPRISRSRPTPAQLRRDLRIISPLTHAAKAKEQAAATGSTLRRHARPEGTSAPRSRSAARRSAPSRDRARHRADPAAPDALRC